MVPKVSIIIPCFNVSKYLKRNLESILKNNFTDFECIYINDGSTDDTGDILDEFARNHNNIKVYHKLNGGVSDARNYGISRASGDYIMFIDPDDDIDSKFISLPYYEAITTQSDLVVFGYYCDWKGTNEYKEYPLKSSYKYSCNQDILKYVFPKFIGNSIYYFNDLLRGRSNNSTSGEAQMIWRWIFHKDFLLKNEIKFKPIKIGEDCIFISECLLNASSISFVNRPLYYYKPTPSGAAYTSMRGVGLLNNKINLLNERKRLITLYSQKNNSKNLEIKLIAGSCILSIFEIAARLSTKYHNYCDYYTYIKDPVVQESIKLGKVSFRNLKIAIPFTLLKLRQYKYLFLIFYLLNKFRIKISI